MRKERNCRYGNENTASQAVGSTLNQIGADKEGGTPVSYTHLGVLMPGIARPMKDGGYEIIAGHRRRHACELVGLTTCLLYTSRCV